jgi:5-methylcytosine-specific restriction endonuclease McrA
MKRSPMRRWHRPEADKVTPELRAAVIARDGVCFLSRLNRLHVCRDKWGNEQRPDENLTVDHVKDEAGMGKRAPSDLRHLVAMCYGANVGVPSREVRILERAYLARLYEEAP